MTENALVIRITGTIDHSNFDEWKQELVAQIRSVRTDLQTEEDFAEAVRTVKALKSAEDTLKGAKQSAIEQAEAIQSLFAAIDEVSAEARKTRLALDRQVKTRKAEIKEEVIVSGMDRIQALLEAQSADFLLVDPSEFADRARLDTAAKGKSSLNGLKKAVDSVCKEIALAIKERAQEVEASAKAILAIPAEHSALFQDRAALLGLSKHELELTIEKRIAVSDAHTAQAEVKALKEERSAVPCPPGSESAESRVEERLGFMLRVELFATKESAARIEAAVRERLLGDAAVKSVRLTREET